jgi:hypothetical protein
MGRQNRMTATTATNGDSVGDIVKPGFALASDVSLHRHVGPFR